MPNTNMTKKEIREASTMELSIRMNALFSSTENNIEGVSLIDAKELVEVDAELKKRLYKALACKRR